MPVHYAVALVRNIGISSQCICGDVSFSSEYVLMLSSGLRCLEPYFVEQG